MNSNLNFALAQSHQQDLRRHMQAAQQAAQVAAPVRLGRIRLLLPRIQFARRIAAVRTTIANA